MSEPIYPGAIWDPGLNAGYRAGRTRMDVAVCHFTVGVNSAPIGRRGYFTWLVGRDGTVTQFAEADALTWHAGEWNIYGPGIEVEYYSAVDGDQIFTDAARDATGALVRWLNSEWGIPLDYYDGPRQSTSDQHGFMSHRSLVQTEQHYDFWPPADWDAMVAPPAPEPAPPPAPMQRTFNDEESSVVVFHSELYHSLNIFSVDGEGRLLHDAALDGHDWAYKGTVRATGLRPWAPVSVQEGHDGALHVVAQRPDGARVRVVFVGTEVRPPELLTV